LFVSHRFAYTGSTTLGKGKCFIRLTNAFVDMSI
jgi:hypothetical protein